MQVPWSGGPIVKCPLIYNSFWGPLWSNAAHQTLANQINQFTQDLLQSKYMNVLSQQCINAGAFPQPVDLHNNASAAILMIYLDDHTIINGGGRQLNFPGAGDLGYHDSFVTANGQPCPYAFMAYFSNVNSTTVVASHEFAEMVTDPLYTAWTPDHAFHEIGDYCEGSNSTITVSGRTWTVQTVWSNHDNGCVASAPNPLPHIAPGPMAAGGAGSQGGVRGFAQHDTGAAASYARLLPLPAVTVDAATGAHSMDQKEVHNYARKMFYPASHGSLFTDFPGFLRSVAGVIEQLAPGGPAPAATEEQSAPSGESGRGPGVARPGTCKSCG